MRSEQRSTLWQSVAAIETLAQQEMALEKVSVKPEAPAAVRVDLGVIFVSLELSKSTWLATSLTPGSDKMSRHSIAGGDIAGLLTVFTDLRKKAQT